MRKLPPQPLLVTLKDFGTIIQIVLVIMWVATGGMILLIIKLLLFRCKKWALDRGIIVKK